MSILRYEIMVETLQLPLLQKRLLEQEWKR
jgi:hypothetical protein